jgi:hypothetical protein
MPGGFPDKSGAGPPGVDGPCHATAPTGTAGRRRRARRLRGRATLGFMGADVVSMTLSLVALIAAMASLALQARDQFANRHQALRSTQLELVRMAIENPVLYLGYEPTAEQRVRFAHRGYVNLFVKYFELGYLTGALGEVEVRHQMGELFAERGPREVWPALRPAWRTEATSTAKRRFAAIVEHEFQKASCPTPTNPADSAAGE